MGYQTLRTAKPTPREMEIVASKLRLLNELGENSFTDEERLACQQVYLYFEDQVRVIRARLPLPRR